MSDKHIDLLIEGGRKKKARAELLVRLWTYCANNPEATNAEAARALSVSRSMVDKHRVTPRKKVNMR